MSKGNTGKQTGEYSGGPPTYYSDQPQFGYPLPQYSPQQGYPQVGYPQANYAPQQGYPQGSYPQAEYAPPQGYVPQQGHAQDAPVQGWQPQAPVCSPPVNENAYYDYKPPASYADVKNYQGSNEWATDMCSAPCKEPCFCLQAFFCPLCCTALQRKRLLLGDWERYRCCAGLCAGCCPCISNECGRCGCFCMIMEVLCCLPCAVHGNRFMVQQHYNLKTDCCDLVLMWMACIIQIVAIILQSDSISLLADCVYLIVLSCMLTQNEHQMRKFQYPNRVSIP